MTASALAAAVHQALLARGETVGCAESLTGGALADLLSSTPGASATFVGGVVAYDTRIKRDVLGVSTTEVVSAECAAQMALGVRRLLGVTWALATTGVAGPAEQDGQAVGTVHVALAGPSGLSGHRLALAGDRTAIRSETCTAVVEALLDALR